MNKLVGKVTEITPTTNENLLHTQLYNLITQEKYGTNFSFNMMKIMSEGIVKRQFHPEQHAVFLHRGSCRILLDKEWVEVQEGNYVYIPSNMIHEFQNTGNTPADIIILKL